MKMSILLENELGWIISHPHFFSNILTNEAEIRSFSLNPDLFDIRSPFVNSKSIDSQAAAGKLSQEFSCLASTGRSMGVFESKCEDDTKNAKARQTAAAFLKNLKIDFIRDEIKFNGANSTNSAVISSVSDHFFIFPGHTKFYCGFINDTIRKYLEEDEFDVIVMDPPWKNKYIWRNAKRRKTEGGGYDLVNNDEISDIPIQKIAAEDALVVVWCTNAVAHQNDIINSMFPKWGVKYLTTWYWVKVTKSGEPICPFSSNSSRKQPYETILIGRRGDATVTAAESDSCPSPDLSTTKLILGVPSSLHSHKPPLIDILRKYTTPGAKFCELNARYLTPGVTAIGNEVIKLQHMSLYTLDEN